MGIWCTLTSRAAGWYKSCHWFWKRENILFCWHYSYILCLMESLRIDTDMISQFMTSGSPAHFFHALTWKWIDPNPGVLSLTVLYIFCSPGHSRCICRVHYHCPDPPRSKTSCKKDQQSSLHFLQKQLPVPGKALFCLSLDFETVHHSYWKEC